MTKLVCIGGVYNYASSVQVDKVVVKMVGGGWMVTGHRFTFLFQSRDLGCAFSQSCLLPFTPPQVNLELQQAQFNFEQSQNESPKMKDVYTALYPNEQVAKGKCSVN
jgi:hypothetical protein